MTAHRDGRHDGRRDDSCVRGLRSVCNVLSATALTTTIELQTSIIAGAGPTTTPGNGLSYVYMCLYCMCFYYIGMQVFQRVATLIFPRSLAPEKCNPWDIVGVVGIQPGHSSKDGL